MALINCPECDKEISDTAQVCPHCGYAIVTKESLITTEPRKKSIGCGTIILGCIVVIIWAGVFDSSSPSPTTTPSKSLARAEQIERNFKPLGQHRKLERHVIASLKDPDSYEHIETVYDDRSDHLYVLMKYRAKNGFGGYTIGVAAAKPAISGTVLDVADCSTQTVDLCQGVTTQEQSKAETGPEPQQFYKWKNKNGSTQYAPLSVDAAKKLNATPVEIR